MDGLRYVITMCGLEYVLIIITATIKQILFVESWDSQIKVIILYVNVTYYSHKIIVDGTGSGYSSSFLDLPTLPLIPFEFRCSGTKQSLLDCSKYPISCSSYNSLNSYNYGGVTCQGSKTLNIFVVLLLILYS